MPDQLPDYKDYLVECQHQQRRRDDALAILLTIAILLALAGILTLLN